LRALNEATIRCIRLGCMLNSGGSQIYIFNRKAHPHMPDKPQSMPSNLLPASESVEFSAEALGITLKTDEKTLIEIDEIQEEAVRAAQASKKFALR